jgi:hypothetical protein
MLCDMSLDLGYCEPPETHAGTTGSDSALALAIDAGRRAGLDVANARIACRKSSIHVELPRAGVMARVEEPERSAAAGRQVQIARLWASRGAPVVPLVRPELQPFVSSGGAVTLWRRLHGRIPVDLGELGRTTRELHDATRGMSLAGLLRHDLLGDTHRWIDWPAEWLADEHRVELRKLLEVLEGRRNSEVADDPLGTVIVHGDLHADNALATDRGLILVDFEDAGVGPASCDFIPLVVGVSRYGNAEAELDRFVRGYGNDPRGCQGFATMCEIYELCVTAWAIRCSEVSPAMAAEAAVRVDGILNGSKVPWSMM